MGTIINPPEGVLEIIRALEENGFAAYAVGGCIRDSVMGSEPKDWDIASNAAPSDVKKLFDKTVDTGEKHGTVTVILGGEPYEVTTFRIDGKYGDNRHPDSIAFTDRLEDDLCRRDFTINAMAWNPEKGIIDLFGGLSDIASHRIRTVGDPDERFGEDALRMLRAVRFAARLNFDIDVGTFIGIRKNSNLILNVSSERIRDELTGILTSDYPMKLVILRHTGLMRLLLPEVDACFDTPQNNPHHVYNVGEHSLQAVEAIQKDMCLRWAMLLHDTGKAVTRTKDEYGIDHFYGHVAKSVEISKSILRRLKFDNKSIEKITRLVKHHDMDIELNPGAVAKAVNKAGEDIFRDLLKVKRADKSAQNRKGTARELECIAMVEKMYEELLAAKSCFKLEDLAVNGNDLIEIGFSEGKEIGRVLSALLDKVLEDQSLNDRDTLIRIARDMAASGGRG
ncbi:MAG: CCA tRNA nucleotidyltransferase [Bacillota bacterium]